MMKRVIDSTCRPNGGRIIYIKNNYITKLIFHQFQAMNMSLSIDFSINKKCNKQ